MGAYPIAPRLVLFCVPLLMIVVAAGLVVVLTSPLRIPKIVASGLLLVVIAAGQLRNVVLVDDPYREEHLRPAVEFWRKATRPGEAVYVTAGALPGWAFYTTDWQAPDTARLARMAREGSSGGPAFENAPSRKRPIDGDGAELAFALGSGVELLGIADGAPVHIGRWRRSPPDSGWARSEAKRIRAAARPTAWVIGTPWFGRGTLLDDALRSLGAVRLDAFVEGGTVAARYQFPGD